MPRRRRRNDKLLGSVTTLAPTGKERGWPRWVMVHDATCYTWRRVAKTHDSTTLFNWMMLLEAGGFIREDIGHCGCLDGLAYPWSWKGIEVLRRTRQLMLPEMQRAALMARLEKMEREAEQRREACRPKGRLWPSEVTRALRPEPPRLQMQEP